MLKQPILFHIQPSTLPKEALAKFYFSTTISLSFMISSYAYLITKIRSRNLKCITDASQSELAEVYLTKFVNNYFREVLSEVFENLDLVPEVPQLSSVLLSSSLGYLNRNLVCPSVDKSFVLM